MSSRLEPSPRSTGIEEGLAARIHDPLWMLARQWQLGEFNGKDAGTPAIIQVTGAASPINAWRGLRTADWTPFDGNADPLDVLVEPEDEAEPSHRERVEAGAHFLRVLSAAGLSKLGPAFLAAHPFDTPVLASDDFAADPLFAAIARRTPDGLRLHDTAAALAANAAQPVAIDPEDLPAVVAAANAWLAWYAAEIHPEPGTGTALTWQEHRMEYGFAVSSTAANGTVLVSDRYPGDGLDWFDFDIDPASAAAPNAAASLPIDLKAIPHPVRFSGMPLPRFWAMEDARTDFGSIDAAPNDVGRLLIVEFATVYGNDWYVLPVKLPAGTLTILSAVTITDVFGRTFTLDRAGKDDPSWNLFSLATRGAAHPAQNGLLLPPTSGHVMESSPVESVLFLRDEMADLAWGVEARVQDALEKTVDRRAAWVAPGKLPPGTRDLPAYRVETVVPDYWIPLAPEKLPTDKSIHLRMVPLELDNNGVPETIDPKGRLLGSSDSGGHLWVYEEEIPREGTQVDRLYRYARWQDGRTSLWTARRRRVGRGEGSSGLRFDILDPG